MIYPVIFIFLIIGIWWMWQPQTCCECGKEGYFEGQFFLCDDCLFDRFY